MSWQQTRYQRPLCRGGGFYLGGLACVSFCHCNSPLIHECEDAQGALLHAHVDATVDKGYLLELTLKAPFFHVRTSCVVTTAISTTAVPEFRALNCLGAPALQTPIIRPIAGFLYTRSESLSPSAGLMASVIGFWMRCQSIWLRHTAHTIQCITISFGSIFIIGLVAIRSVITSQGTCSTPMSMKRYPIADGCWILGERSARKCSLVPRWGNPTFSRVVIRCS
ncbi:hypothetical protein EDB85DRAFT_1913385 [Lactarius pseudohatsudake]|nr:hypothetical protein EDB85DRAFT_1913385 [Lactarius pseudohatsudake]